MRRVVVTGLGPVSSIGTGVKPFATSLRAGVAGMSEIRSFDASMYAQTQAGVVRDFRPEAHLVALSPSEWGRTSLLAASAARLAVADAGLDLDTVDADRMGAVIGTTSGESLPVHRLAQHLASGSSHASASGILALVPTERIAYAVCREFGAAGEAVTVATACSAGNYALGYAYDLLAHDEADVMVAGGADCVTQHAHAGFLRTGAMSSTMCSPFDRDRRGMILGEGAAVLALEALDHAVARGARLYAEVLGYGMTCDAHHAVRPHPGRIAECIRVAHRNAGVDPGQVDYICAHGTGTLANDLAEATAAREVFGDRVPPMSSIKSMIGHTQGAASAFGAIACALAITEGFLPPTINHTTPDPGLTGIDPVPNVAREADVRVAENHGFAFGGNSAITMLGRVA